MQVSIVSKVPNSTVLVRLLLLLALAIAAGVPMVHSPANAQARQAAQPRFSVDTSISTLAADKRAKAVVDKYMPGMTSGPHYLLAAAFTPRQIKSRMSGTITEAKFNQMQKELSRLP